MGSLKETLTIEKESHLCNISYLPYINPTNDVFRRKLVEMGKIPNSAITIQKENVYDGKKKVEDGEIDVFGAEKYFNGEIEETIAHQHTKTQKSHLSTSKVTVQTRSPSIHSQSSWNSQHALLQSSRKSQVHNTNSKWRHGKSFLSTLTRSCSCCDKNSIDIEEHTSESFSKKNLQEEVDLDQMKRTLINPCMEEMQMKKVKDFKMVLEKEECFTFPHMYPGPKNFETKLFFQEEKGEKKEKSLEVSSYPILANRNESIFSEKKVDLFTLDANNKREEIDYPPSSNGVFDGFESDSSSDLFEIKINNTNPCLLRQALNVSTNNSPSESSIEWSGVTATAAQFSNFSLAYPNSPFMSVVNSRKSATNGKVKDVGKGRLGIMSACKSQKAIIVAEDAYKRN